MTAPVRIRPIGYASEPTSEQEAVLIQNLLLSRDGYYSSRYGLTTRWTAPAAINHVSNHPNGRLMVSANANLYRLDPANSWALETIETGGWPTGDAMAAAEAEGYWFACKTSLQGSSAAPRAVSSAGAITTVATPTNGTMVENHNRMLMMGNYSDARLSWSNDGDPAGSWSAAKAFLVSGIGRLQRVVNISDSQSLAIGDHAAATVGGPDSLGVSQQSYANVGTPHGASVVKCGDFGVCWQSDNGHVHQFRGGLNRIDEPINSEIRGIFPGNNRGFYADALNFYGISNANNARTWLYDLTRNHWQGIWDKFLVGCGRTNHASAAQWPVFGMGAKLVEYGGTDYLDDGSPITCAIEIVGLEAFELFKRLKRVWLDVEGTWTLTLYGRDTSNAAWTQLWVSAAAAGPRWIFPDRHMYRQRKIRLAATGSASIRFREALLYESIVRTGR